MKKKQIRLKEMEIQVLCGLNENNHQQLQATLESYRSMLFPGAEEDKQQDEAMKRAQELLAEEADKVLLIRKVQPGKRVDPRLAKLDAHRITALEKEKMKMARRKRTSTRKK